MVSSAWSAVAIFATVFGLQVARLPSMLPTIDGHGLIFALNETSAFIRYLTSIAKRVCSVCGRAVYPWRRLVPGAHVTSMPMVPYAL